MRRIVSILAISFAGLMSWSGTSQAGMFDQVGVNPKPTGVTSLPDGRILVVADGSARNTVVLAFDADGSIDRSFGTNGVWRSPLPISPEPALVAVQGDKVIVLDAWTLFRLNSDGTTDQSFGDDGRTETPTMSTLTVLNDDRLLVTGTDLECNKYSSCQKGDSYLARYSPDGVPDQSFGVDGVSKLDLRESGALGLFGAAVDGTGRIYAAGGNALARFDPAGQLDPSFGDGGSVYLPFSVASLEPLPVVVADGMITVTGPTAPGPLRSRTTLIRFDVSGTLDSTFGSGGVATFPGLGYLGLSAGTGGAVDALGVKQAACPDADCQIFGPAVARYRASGQLDPGWGEDGLAFHEIGPDWGQTAAAIRQVDGKTVFAAALPLKQAHRINRISVVRLDQRGSLDESFGRAGQTIEPVSVPRCESRLNFLYLTPGQDLKTVGDEPIRVIGTDRRDFIAGGGGRDSICGRPGGDVIKGKAQRDRLFAEAGPDRVNGGIGRDLLKGGTGNDRIFARDGFRDRVNCGPGRDVATVDPKDRATACEKVRR